MKNFLFAALTSAAFVLSSGVAYAGADDGGTKAFWQKEFAPAATHNDLSNGVVSAKPIKKHVHHAKHKH